jgi:transketolase
MDKLSYKTYVLMGDGEMAEGQIWESIELASKYRVNNLIGIIDVNRLGQSGETMLGWDVKDYQKRISSFGWETIVIDGHNFKEISHAYSLAHSASAPFMIIAKTIKGKGVKSLENKEGFHGKPLPHDEVGEAEKELGEIDKSIRGVIAKPNSLNRIEISSSPKHISRVAEYKPGNEIATRKAYGDSLLSLVPDFPSLVVLDAEVSNSTYSESVKKQDGEKFLEMYIAEQNMVSAALGLNKRGKMPFVSTFAAFFTRAHDQIRMAAYSRANIKFVGSHAGVSIGEDGPSQMGLEDISLFRAIPGSSVFYPSDANATKKLTEQMAKNEGIFYLRTTRMETPVIYDSRETFEPGGSKTLKSSSKDRATIVAAGVTLHEAIKAYGELDELGLSVRLIDLYSVKPLDSATLRKAAEETGVLVVVEDHYKEGGIYEAVCSELVNSKADIYSLCVTKKPRSGKPAQLLHFEEIDSDAIVKKVRELIR